MVKVKRSDFREGDPDGGNKKKKTKGNDDNNVNGKSSNSRSSGGGGGSVVHCDYSVGGLDDSDWALRDAERFDELVVERIQNLQESRRLLRRTRAVTVLSQKLMAASDESQCYKQVAELLVSLFGVQRSSYALVVRPEKEGGKPKLFSLTHCSVSSENYYTLEHNPGKFPLEGTAIGHCAKTLEIVYNPKASRNSVFTDHQKISSMGLRTIANVPILAISVNGIINNNFNNMGVESFVFQLFDKIFVLNSNSNRLFTATVDDGWNFVFQTT